ncbi:Prespore protein Dp87 [Madurella mycetomatis]|uniref:Prespore protein Dp87 n=1 Tax=Madurella mycetomatis TaxID=100816 RepID=A0A175W6D4_9PEZI|nr:Prespore protein Dp87 [Madurella mycetomatis]
MISLRVIVLGSALILQAVANPIGRSPPQQQPRQANGCANVRCDSGTRCAVIRGEPICVPVLRWDPRDEGTNSCANVRCDSGTRCVVIRGEPICVPVLRWDPRDEGTNSCTNVRCDSGTRCAVIRGEPICVPVLRWDPRDEGTKCGPNVCPKGQTCCNESCGFCTGPGETCTKQGCLGPQCGPDANFFCPFGPLEVCYRMDW